MCGSVLFVHSLSGKTFANHVSNNTHHCGTSVIKFDIQLTGLSSGSSISLPNQ